MSQPIKAFSDSLLTQKIQESQQVFVSDFNSEVSYEAFIIQTKLTCVRLKAILESEQSIVFLIAENSSLYVTFLFALNYLRQIVMPISPHLPARELRELVQTYRPTLILTEAALEGESLAPFFTFESLLSNASDSPAEFPLIEHSQEDICFILLTSGSRTASKGAVLTNANIVNNLAGIQAYMNLSSEDRCLIVRSLTHASALVGELLLTVVTRSTCVLRHTPPTVQRLFAWCERNHITWLGLPPILLEAVVRIGRKQHINLPVRRVVVSGSILRPDLCVAFCNAFPDVELVNAYGLTEASPRVSYLPPSLALVKPGSTGYAIEGCRVRVVDSSGNECPAGKLGEVQVAGGNVMLGYFPLDNTTNVFAGEWLKTGDEGYIDNDGCLFITRRIDSVIIHRGINISPEHVSSIIEECDGVIRAEVTQIGDSSLGARLVAFVQFEAQTNPMLLLEQIREYLNLNLDKRKHPEEFVFVEEFPITSSGKVLIKTLVAEYTERCGFRVEKER